MKNKFTLFTFIFSLLSFHILFSQSWLWGKYGSGYGNANSVATDLNGNCYLSGYFYGEDTLNFSGTILVNPYHTLYGASFFLVKYNSYGNVLWARQSINYGNFYFGNGGTISLDNSGDVYINASFTDTNIVGVDTFIFPSSLYETAYLIAKYSSNGNFLWASSCNLNIHDTNGISSNNISTDNFGNVFVTGIFNADTVYIGSQYILGKNNQTLPFLIKYDSGGNVLWANAAAGHYYQYNGGDGLWVANDREGNSYITGNFGDSIWFGSDRLLSGNENDVYLVKYSPNGNVLWAKQASEPSENCSSQGVALVTDKSGNIYLAGDYSDSIIIGNDTLIANNLYPQYQYSFFLAKYDSGGNVLWAKSCKVLDSNGWGACTLSIDKYNHLYLSGGGGHYHCKVAFGGDTLSLYDTSVYDYASIIYKLDSNGNVLCSSILSGGAYMPNSISSDSSGNYVYFGSTAETPLIFGNDTINPFPNWNPIYGNYFPFAARWGECGEIVTPDNEVKGESEKVKVYPNPNNGIFTLAFGHAELVSYESLWEASQTEIEIYNVFGEKVLTETLRSAQDDNTINLKEQPSGIYLYRVLNNDGSLVGEGKVIVEK